MTGDEKSSFKGADRKITVSVSSSEEIVQDTAGVADIKAKDVTQDSEARSPFSRAESRVLAVVETEENSLEESAGIEASKGTLKLLNGSAELIKVSVEKVIVVIDESQIKGDNKSEASQINISSTAFFESGELVSQSNDVSGGSFTGNEVNEGSVGLGEAGSSEFSIGRKVALSEESVGNNVLVILTLDDVAEIVLAEHAGLFGGKEVLDIDTKASRC